jgi:hypothetical protein
VSVRPVIQLGSLDFSARTVASRIYVKRILKSAVFVLATVYFIVDAIFLTIAIPLARWIARQKIFIRLRKWIGSLRPYPSLALFTVPLIVLEPVKPVAAYLIATGKIAAGITTLVVGELLKLVIVERLFKLCRRKLLKIPIFAWGYGHWRQGVEWLVSMKAWQAARRWSLKIKDLLHKLIMRSTRPSSRTCQKTRRR